MSLDEVWASVPPDTWVALKRTTGAHPGLDPRYGFYAEIGFKGDWRTGEISGASAADALRRAVMIAQEIRHDR